MLLVLDLHHFLLPPQLQHLAVRIRVLRQNKRWARRGPVLWDEPARLVPHAARIAERFWAHGPSPPLRGLVRGAMQALPPLAAAFRAGVRRRRRLRVRGEHNEARGPVAWGSTCPLAPSLAPNRHLRVEHNRVWVTRFRRCSIVLRSHTRYQLQLLQILARKRFVRKFRQPFQFRKIIILLNKLHTINLLSSY